MPIFINSYSFGKSWVLMSGVLYQMTSNNAPTPYIASGYATGTPSSTSYYISFNNNFNDDAQYFTGTGGYWQLTFGTKFIKAKTVSLKFKSASSGTIKLYGLDNTDTWVEIDSFSVSTTTATYTRTPTQTEIKGIRVLWQGNAGFHALFECQITEWYE